jgi:hypothetical protein
LCGVTVAESLLVYAVAPLAIIAVLAALTLRPDPGSRRRRYRPGQPWEHEPLWYSPHAGALETGHGVDTASTPHGRTQAIGSSVYGEVGDGSAASHGSPHGSTQGSSHGATHGATAVSTGAPVVGRGGPLGGARGTW